MATWYGSSRSNYFRVKDCDAFLQWVERRGLGLFKNSEDATLFAIHSGDSTDGGSWPSYDLEADTEIDLVAELAQHLPKRGCCCADGDWRREAAVSERYSHRGQPQRPRGGGLTG